MKSTPSTRTERGRLRRLITRTLLTIGLTIGGIATTATPAEAANYVYGCFRSANGFDLWSMTAKLQYWTGSGWATAATSQLGPQGALVPGFSCVGWPVSTEYYFMVVVDHRPNPSSPTPWWWGATSVGYAYSPSWGYWHEFGYGFAVPGDHRWVLFGEVSGG